MIPCNLQTYRSSKKLGEKRGNRKKHSGFVHSKWTLLFAAGLPTYISKNICSILYLVLKSCFTSVKLKNRPIPPTMRSTSPTCSRIFSAQVSHVEWVKHACKRNKTNQNTNLISRKKWCCQTKHQYNLRDTEHCWSEYSMIKYLLENRRKEAVRHSDTIQNQYQVTVKHFQYFCPPIAESVYQYKQG